MKATQVLFVGVHFALGLLTVRAEDATKFASPDGKFAMLLTDDTDEGLKSGALVLMNAQGWETNDGILRGCTQTVTIAQSLFRLLTAARAEVPLP